MGELITMRCGVKAANGETLRCTSCTKRQYRAKPFYKEGVTTSLYNVDCDEISLSKRPL